MTVVGPETFKKWALVNPRDPRYGAGLRRGTMFEDDRDSQQDDAYCVDCFHRGTSCLLGIDENEDGNHESWQGYWGQSQNMNDRPVPRPSGRDDVLYPPSDTEGPWVMGITDHDARLSRADFEGYVWIHAPEPSTRVCRIGIRANVTRQFEEVAACL